MLLHKALAGSPDGLHIALWVEHCAAADEQGCCLGQRGIWRLSCNRGRLFRQGWLGMHSQRGLSLHGRIVKACPWQLLQDPVQHEAAANPEPRERQAGMHMRSVAVDTGNLVALAKVWPRLAMLEGSWWGPTSGRTLPMRFCCLA